jgi:hypothetical protein
MRMSTHIAAYDDDDDVIYEPPRRILRIDIVAECCFLTFFDHADTSTSEADIYTATQPAYLQTIVPTGTLLRVLLLQTAARHVRSASIPALGEADTFRYADEVLVVSVIGETAYLDVHRADPNLRRPTYPARGTIRVPAPDLIQALQTHLEDEEAGAPLPRTPVDTWDHDEWGI